MAWVRKRRLRTGTFYFVVDSGRSRAAGKGEDGRQFANEWAENVNRARRRARAGMAPEPGGCRWTLRDLKDRDIADAHGRGLVALKRRESHWTLLLAGFGADTNLDQITPASIAAYVRWRQKRGKPMQSGKVRPVGPAAINRDLRSVLAPALKLARRLRDESGYAGRPFDDLPQLEERRTRRKPRVLTAEEYGNLVRAAWDLATEAPKRLRTSWEQNAAIIELWFLTASRFNQVLHLQREDVSDDGVRFPAQKRGSARVFRFEGFAGRRVRELLRRQAPDGPWVFGRAGKPRVGMKGFWRLVTAAAKLPDLKPHDLRHTASREALRQGRGIVGVQGILGHATPGATERVYLTLYPESMLPVAFGGKAVARATEKNASPKRHERKHERIWWDRPESNRRPRV